MYMYIYIYICNVGTNLLHNVDVFAHRLRGNCRKDERRQLHETCTDVDQRRSNAHHPVAHALLCGDRLSRTGEEELETRYKTQTRW